MHVLIVYAHPEPTSFNGALKDRAVAALAGAGHTVTVSDLYAERFDPVAGRHDCTTVADPARFHYQSEQEHAARHGGVAADLAREQARVAAADALLLQFPLWWGGVPAILKGWIDRVLAYGFGYVDGRRFERGLLVGRRAMVSVTTGGPETRFGPDGVYGEIEKVLWQVEHLSLEYMGLALDPRFVAYAAPRVDEAGRTAYLDAFAGRVLAMASRPVVRPAVAEDPFAGLDAGAWARRA